MPYLGSTVFFVTLVGALVLALTAWWLFVRSLAPGFVGRARDRWSRRPVLTVLLGAVTGGFATLVLIALFAVGHPAASFVATVAATGLLAFALAGTAGLAQRIGEGLASPTDEGREWFRCLKGGAVLELCFLLPVLGWFLVLPIAVYGGLGAALGSVALGIHARLRAPAAHAESA
ncbi:MAG: hypothetical protein KC619_35800 [Myxococcales bacterium]|nr:hypothetical protein [Myxococcales bacterium]